MTTSSGDAGELRRRSLANTVHLSPIEVSSAGIPVFEVDYGNVPAEAVYGGYKNLSDIRALLFLLLLYTIQGVPMGLSAAVPFLLQGHVSYNQLGFFSFVSLPFSLKVFWAPIVDSIYWRQLGRRKSWLVPIQFICCLLMLWGSMASNVDTWLGSAGFPHRNDESFKPNVLALTLYFAVLYFLMATQDIVVDGWALTLLTERKRPLASMANAIGQTLGFSVAHFGFLAMQDPATCNRILRRRPSEFPIVTLGSFIGFWSVCVFVSTILSFFFTERSEFCHSPLSQTKPNGRTTPPQDQPMEKLSICDSYIYLLKMLQNKSVLQLAFVLVTCRFAFGSIDGAAHLKLIEAGIHKEELALLGPVLVPISLISPLLISRVVCGSRPLQWFTIGWLARCAVSLVWLGFIYLTSVLLKDRQPEDRLPAYLYVLLCIVSAMHCSSSDIMFSAQMGFFARVSDPAIGGTYMTFLNTIANIGHKWPATLALFTLTYFDSKFVDGFYVQSILLIFFGFCLLRLYSPLIDRLQRLDLDAWKVVK